MTSLRCAHSRAVKVVRNALISCLITMTDVEREKMTRVDICMTRQMWHVTLWVTRKVGSSRRLDLHLSSTITFMNHIYLIPLQDKRSTASLWTDRLSKIEVNCCLQFLSSQFLQKLSGTSSEANFCEKRRSCESETLVTFRVELESTEDRPKRKQLWRLRAKLVHD